MSFVIAALLLAVTTSVTCALPGTFLVLRRQSMLVDAMSHAVLPGIVIGALLAGSTYSPIMVLLAAAFGLVVVLGANYLQSTGLLPEDASQGVIFPLLFSVGVILLSTVLAHVHICEDTVLSGDLNLLALDTERLIIGTLDLGPRAMWMLLLILLINAIFLGLTYKVMQLSTFDRESAQAIGFPIRVVETGFMILVALTIVVAFSTAGAILVIALMVTPAATAVLLTNSLPRVIALTIVISMITAIIGFSFAWHFNLATAAMMAFTDGILFLLVLFIDRIWLNRRYRNA
ncbi:metal ABC transporter permease [Arcanobacterium hippocoleae]|uniref:Manganese/zinc/iron transport system permease protein n=1 Tax=Arcanobacterium hippocoleae TaxID=149017 RepID=A0ABU1T190_9ACTO|nr:metal ABC transporter permease [Arcanobacterium hippocoleae]MDR6939130.1 manganese/zinc/iron transport system permease protein [Arcanobacterium hippocoleae]